MGSGVELLHVYAFAAIQTVPNMKTTVFLDVTPYSLVYKCRRFRGTCYVHPHDRKTWSGKRTFFSHKDAAEYYCNIWYMSNRIPGNTYRKRIILIIITTARTSNVTWMKTYFVTGHLPDTQHSGKLLMITEHSQCEDHDKNGKIICK
jgi:hypothetical protein